MHSPDGDAQKRAKHFFSIGGTADSIMGFGSAVLLQSVFFPHRVFFSQDQGSAPSPPLLLLTRPFPAAFDCPEEQCIQMPFHAIPCHSRQQDCQRGKTWLAIFIPILFAFEGMKQYCYRGLFHFLLFLINFVFS